MSLSEQIQRVDGSQNDIIKALAQSYGISTDGLKIDQVASAVKSSQKFKQDGLFSASTAALFGLGSDAVPDDVLAWIGKYNQYWWEKSAINTNVIKADIQRSIIVGEDGTGIALLYAKDIRVNSDGTIGLVDPSYVEGTFGSSSAAISIMKRLTNNSPCYVTGFYGDPGGVYFLPTGSTVSTSYETTFHCSASKVDTSDIATVKCQVVSTAGDPPVVEYVQSQDSSAYPEYGEQDGNLYGHLGVPLNLATSSPRTEQGSYVGTGAYGVDNPNKLTFGFEPKLIFIGGPYCVGLFLPGHSGYLYVEEDQGSANVHLDSWAYRYIITGNSLIWYCYNSTADRQLNKQGFEYRYIALG